jgi:hypothetical protein
MTALFIKPATTKELPGDLHAQLDDGNLLVPVHVAYVSPRAPEPPTRTRLRNH